MTLTCPRRKAAAVVESPDTEIEQDPPLALPVLDLPFKEMTICGKPFILIAGATLLPLLEINADL